MNHQLIVIEGLDGSGKATQSNLLYEYLKEQGYKVRKLSFPDYNNPGCQLVKMYLNGDFGDNPNSVNAYAASSFYAVDRYSSYMTDWKKDYEQGIILADRYSTSNLIHQCAKLPHDQWNSFIEWVNEYEYKLLGIPEPNLIIYLKMNPMISQELLESRYNGDESKKDIHEKNVEYLMKCKEAADYCAHYLGWSIVDCCTHSNLIKPIDTIQLEIRNFVY